MVHRHRRLRTTGLADDLGRHAGHRHIVRHILDHHRARADAGARESGLGTALLRVEPVAEGQVRMVFQQVGFDALMAWLEQFSRSQSLRGTEFNVQTTGASGQVDARIGLEERR